MEAPGAAVPVMVTAPDSALLTTLSAVTGSIVGAKDGKALFCTVMACVAVVLLLPALSWACTVTLAVTLAWPAGTGGTESKSTLHLPLVTVPGFDTPFQVTVTVSAFWAPVGVSPVKVILPVLASSALMVVSPPLVLMLVGWPGAVLSRVTLCVAATEFARPGCVATAVTS